MITQAIMYIYIVAVITAQHPPSERLQIMGVTILNSIRDIAVAGHSIDSGLSME